MQAYKNEPDTSMGAYTTLSPLSFFQRQDEGARSSCRPPIVQCTMTVHVQYILQHGHRGDCREMGCRRCLPSYLHSFMLDGTVSVTVQFTLLVSYKCTAMGSLMAHTNFLRTKGSRRRKGACSYLWTARMRRRY